MKKLFKLMLSLLMAVSVIGGGIIASTDTAKAYSLKDYAGYIIHASGETITPTVATTSILDLSNSTYDAIYYNSSTKIQVGGSTVYGTKVALNIKERGDVYIDILGTSISNSGNASLKVYNDSACTSEYTSLNTSIENSYAGAYFIRFPQAGTYYLTFYSNGTPTDNDILAFQLYEYSAANKTLTSGKWQAIAAYNEANYGYRYYKMTLTAAKDVTITSNSTYLDYAICKSDKTVKYSGAYLCSKNSYKNHVYLSAGTYYIRTYGSSDATVTDGYGSLIKVTYSNPYYFTSSKTMTICPTVDNSYVYFKYKASKTGVLKITQTNGGQGTVQLLNSNKKVLNSSSGDKLTSSLVYGVKKGNTYYIRVKSNYYAVTLKMTTTGISENSGTTKAKAKSISMKTTRKGTITAGSSQADWYKITLSSKKYLKINFKGSTNGKLKVTVYASNGKNLGSINGPGNNFVCKLTSEGKEPAGTYYIKVQRTNSTSSGNYSLYWYTSSSK